MIQVKEYSEKKTHKNTGHENPQQQNVESNRVHIFIQHSHAQIFMSIKFAILTSTDILSKAAVKLTKHKELEIGLKFKTFKETSIVPIMRKAL